MRVLHGWREKESAGMVGLREFVLQHREKWRDGTPSFEEYERELHERIMALEREMLQAELARYNVDAQEIEVGGKRYHQVLEGSESYLSAAKATGVLLGK